MLSRVALLAMFCVALLGAVEAAFAQRGMWPQGAPPMIQAMQALSDDGGPDCAAHHAMMSPDMASPDQQTSHDTHPSRASGGKSLAHCPMSGAMCCPPAVVSIGADVRPLGASHAVVRGDGPQQAVRAAAVDPAFRPPRFIL